MGDTQNISATEVTGHRLLRRERAKVLQGRQISYLSGRKIKVKKIYRPSPWGVLVKELSWSESQVEKASERGVRQQTMGYRTLAPSWLGGARCRLRVRLD